MKGSGKHGSATAATGRCLWLLGLLAAFAGLRSTAAAQTILVRVLGAETSAPIYGAMAWLLDADGTPLDRALTDEQGRYLFAGVAPGRYRVRAEMIGRATTESDVFTVEPSGESVVRTLSLESQVIELEGLGVEGERRCSLRPEEGERVARVWDEARKALDAASFTDTHASYRYRTVTSERELDRDNRSVLKESRRILRGYMSRPYQSLPAAKLLEKGFVQTDAAGVGFYYAPDAGVLLSDGFLDTHCFGLRVGRDEHAGSIGLTFEPVRGRRVPEISGVLWLDGATMALGSLDFRYENLEHGVESDLIGGHIDFQRLPDGTWIIPEWFIRMPKLAGRRGPMGTIEPYIDGYVQTTGVVREVQEPGGAVVLDAESATIDGIVVDSLGAEPLAGIRVQVAGAPDSAVTGSDGRFRFTELSGGTYRIEYRVPYLDSLGFGPDPVEVDANAGHVVSARLQAPARAALVTGACADEDRPPGSAFLTGRVAGPGGEGVEGATVRISWETYGRVAAVIFAHANGVAATTDADGFYRVCAVPTDEELLVEISRPSLEAVRDTVRIPLGRATARYDFVIPGGR